MSSIKEVITHEPQDKDAWVCICGNMPPDAGFYPCDKDGNEMEPVIGSDWAGLYVCNECGRIINQDTLEVVGQNPNPKFLD
jgi:hypothetical protein